MSQLLPASLLSIALALTVFGCSGDDDEPNGAGGRSGSGGAGPTAGTSNGGTGNGGCPNLAGMWTVTKHCQTNFVNTQVEVTQTGCTASVPSFNFSGTVGANGELNLSSGMGSCTGAVNGNTINEECVVFNLPCTVQLTR
jgi:hypothetical protein